MSEPSEVVPASALTGKPILSLESGNKLGRTLDVLIDPVNGRLLGLNVENEGRSWELPYEEIYSVGKDAVMAVSDVSLKDGAQDGQESRACRAHDLLATQVVMESGDILGEIADVLVTLKPPPAVIYEVRRSLLDRFLGRTFFIPASVGNVLSADAKRLLVPDITAEIATDEIPELSDISVDVRSFRETRDSRAAKESTNFPQPDEDATVLRTDATEDNTLIVGDDGDETVLRQRPSTNEE